MFGIRLFGKSGNTKQNDDSSGRRFGRSPKRNNQQATAPRDAASDYLQKQDTFMRLIGPHMRFGVDAVIQSGTLDLETREAWDADLKAIGPSDRGQLLVDWARWHALRAHPEASKVVIFDKDPRALPLLQNTFRLPHSLNDASHLKHPIEFSEDQAKDFLTLACESASLKDSHLHLRETKRLLSALKKAIRTPDEALATNIRNANYKMTWAKPLLKQLCPLEAASGDAQETSGKIENKEDQAIAEALRDLQNTLKRLPGMWLRVPAEADPFWGALDHQFFPCFSEIRRYLDALESAANRGRNVDHHKNQLAALLKIATNNLQTLHAKRFEKRSLDEITADFPEGETLRTSNIYWLRNRPEYERHVFDDYGRPKVKLILAIEEEWYAGFEDRCQRILAIEQKSGVSEKLIDLLPGENASAPTKTWLKNARAAFNESDLDEILGRLQGSKPQNPQDVLFNPTAPAGAYDAAMIATREFHAMVWAAHLAGEKAAEPLYALASENYRKVPGVGPKNAKLANAAAVSLSLMEGGQGVSYLLRLQREVKYPKIKKTLDKRIEEASGAQGQSKQSMEEQAVKDYGFA